MREEINKKPPKKKPILPSIHYVCTGGCQLVSPTQSKCMSSDCPRVRNPLTICECTNGKHGKLLLLNASKIPR